MKRPGGGGWPSGRKSSRKASETFSAFICNRASATGTKPIIAAILYTYNNSYDNLISVIVSNQIYNQCEVQAAHPGHGLR